MALIRVPPRIHLGLNERLDCYRVLPSFTLSDWLPTACQQVRRRRVPSFYRVFFFNFDSVAGDPSLIWSPRPRCPWATCTIPSSHTIWFWRIWVSDIGLSGTAGETGKKKTASSSAVATEHFDPLASAHDRFSLSYSFFFWLPLSLIFSS